MLTPGLAQQYGFMENGTHLSFTVPFSAPDVVYEVQSVINVGDIAVEMIIVHIIVVSGNFSGC